MQDAHHGREAQLGVWSHGHKRVRPNGYGARDPGFDGQQQQYAPQTNTHIPTYSDPAGGMNSYGPTSQNAYKGYDYTQMGGMAPSSSMSQHGGRQESCRQDVPTQHQQYPGHQSQYYQGEVDYATPVISHQSTAPLSHYMTQTDWPDHAYSSAASWSQPVAPFDTTGLYGKDASLHLKLQSLAILDNLVRISESGVGCVF